MRILLLSRYGRTGASSRLRHYQFLPALRAAGLEVTVSPFLPDAYLAALYGGGGRQPGMVAAAYWRRLLTLASARRHDLLWVEKEFLPWLPFGLEALLLRGAPPFVVDYDDAWFHLYDSHGRGAVRRLLGGKLDRIMRRAALVTAGNSYLAARAEAAGARRVALLPTVVDLAHYGEAPPTAEPPASEPLTVGWIGSPATAAYLDGLREPLRRLCAAGLVRIVLVGAGDGALAGVPAERLPWSEDSEAACIRRFDVGVMPLPDTPWARGKCGYKLIQYMACGKPVVASPVGANCDIVDPGETGLLAETPEEWLAALRRLAEDFALRRSLGAAGRAKVERLYTVERLLPRLIEALRHAPETAGP